MSKFIDRLLNLRTLQRWRTAAHAAHSAPLSVLRRNRNDARKLRAQLNQLVHVADGRMALPHIGSTYFPRPHGTDWSWRPELWRGPLPVAGVSSPTNKTSLGNEVQLFHDCALAEVTLRQLRNTREEDLAPYGLQLEVFKFEGSFLSLVIDLPTDASLGLTRQHLIRMDCITETEHPIRIFARLNIQNGPNTEHLVRELPLGEKSVTIEYDLAYSHINEKRIEKAWIDLIFESPDMNQVVLRDLTFARCRRANL